MTAELAQKDGILRAAGSLFLDRGFRAVTMDDIAQSLRISKKTIYVHFPTKKVIVESFVRLHVLQNMDTITSIIENAIDPIDGMKKVGQFIIDHFQKMPPKMVLELKKYFPETWQEIQDRKIRFMQLELEKNMNIGIEEGFYRKNIRPNLISWLFVQTINDVFLNTKIPNDTAIFENIFTCHIYGIVSEKGRLLFDKYQNKKA